MADSTSSTNAAADKPVKPPLGESAGVQRSLQVVYGGNVSPDDETLATRAAGKGIKLYRDIERDGHAWAVLDKRRRAVIARPWNVEAATDDPRDKQAADLVAEQLRRMPFDRVCYELLDAVLMGYAVSEVMWQIDADQVRPINLISRGQERFRFDDERQLRLITRNSPTEGELLEARKFIVHRHGGRDANPYGLGLGTRLFWPCYFKRQDISFWLVFLDKFGGPTALGKYPSGAQDEEKRTLLAALASIRQDSAVVIPDGMTAELLEAARSGSSDAYERLARYMDEQISLIVLGETMTTTAASAGLGSNQANVHNDVRIELAMADADLLADTLQATLCQWIVDFNVPGAGVPRIQRQFDEPEDKNTTAERDKKLTEMGLEPEDQYIKDTYPGWRRKAAAAPANPIQPAPEAPPPAEFAAPDAETFPDQVELDALLDSLPAPELQAQAEQLLRPVIDMLESASSYDEALGGLAEVYPDMATDKLQDMVSRAFASAAAFGILAVRDERKA